MRRPVFSLVAVVLVITLGGGLWLLHCRRGPRPPFELSFWFWQGPFALTNAEVQDLRSLGVKRLFVRAGTFTTDGRQVLLKIPQTWKSNAGHLPVHLVFNFDAGMVAHFREFSATRVAEDVGPRIEKQIDAAENAGINIEGVQFDFDVPTRLLPKYAKVLRRVRQGSKRLAKGSPLRVSATGLVTWLGKKGLREVSEQLDFLTPQFYEGVTGRTADTMRPVSDLRAFARHVKDADDLACPYYAGIPAYGHALLYDETGRLVSNYAGLRPADALRHPSFRLIEAYPANPKGGPAKTEAEWVGEEMMKLRAIHSGRDGRGYGYTLGYSLPTPELLRRYLETAKRLQSDRCLGAIVYRYPEQGQSLALPMASIRSVLAGRTAAPRLTLKVATNRDTYDLIDADRPPANAPIDAYLEVKNDGDAPLFVAPDALRVQLSFDQGGFDDITRRDMNSVEVTGPSTVVFHKSSLAPGETAYAGPIRLLGAAHQVNVRYSFRLPDGFRKTQSQLPPNSVR